MKRTLTHIGILAAVFVVAVIGFSYITNQGSTDLTADIASATLPGIKFSQSGYFANYLVGYTNEMELTTMRDTITPLDAEGNAEVFITEDGAKVKSLTYEVFSLNGEEKYLEKTEKKISSPMKFSIGSKLPEGKEGVLKITLNLGEKKKAYYYTRVIASTNLHTKECMKFADDFHTKTFDRENSNALTGILETNEEGDNTTLRRVTIHSDLNHVTWGNLEPSIVGEVQWDIKEVTDVYTSLQLRYQVNCRGEMNEEERYNVKEYFRVMYHEGNLYLMDYDRIMNQIFDGSKSVLDQDGIVLGVADPDVEYMTNKDGTLVSFVQERELWNYNKKDDELSLVFTFASAENTDIRNRYDQHNIKIISVDDNGSTAFAVYGYMNRGEHEGKVGVAIYYFDIEKNAVEEKAFIPSNKSATVAEDELGRLVYYSSKHHVLYTLIDGTLYKINLDDKKQEELVKNLEAGQYVASEDGSWVAYQAGGKESPAQMLEVLNLKNGKSWQIEREGNENLIPLGFIGNDFVYGKSMNTDIGKTIAGESVVPMYQLEIRNSKNEVLKTYQADGIYILDVFVENGLITMNRVSKNGDVYAVVEADYIANNEERAESNISLKSFWTDLKETQMQIRYEDGIKDQNPKLLKPKLVIYENPVTLAFSKKDDAGKYYVYGMGEMQGVYERAGYAVKEAFKVSGVAISSKQAYVWQVGNRYLEYRTENLPECKIGENETGLMACIRTILAYEGSLADVKTEMGQGKSAMGMLNEFTMGDAMDLTGCTTEELLYIIGRGTPVIAMTDMNNALLLVGYDRAYVIYIDPNTGEEMSVPYEQMDEMVKGSGSTFIGYVK